MRRFVFRALVIAAFFYSGSLTVVSQQEQAGHQTGGSCPRSIAIDEFKKSVLSGGGVVDSPHVNGGIAVIATAGERNSNVAAIQKAAKDYLERVKGIGMDKGTGPCGELSRAISEGKIAETMVPFGAGVLFLITSQDKKLEKLIQESDCCKWCGPCGPHSTAGCCRRC